jgi:GT2 family glycosyltransferase
LASNDTYPQHVVTAVIVAHDGAAWLPHVIDGLLGQTRPVQRVVAVDTGSRDRSGSVLAAKLGQGVVFGMDRTTGYGSAVAKALQHKAANVSVPGRPAQGREERVEWIWLLHDDCEPAPDALEQLLRGAAETPNAAVLGPKVMDWSDRDVILEAGVTIDTVGRRITGIEPREVDQGQHDGDRDTLAVGSAGMLVRRDVWDQIRGFDTSMGLFREDIDFCWRVHADGSRVRVITDAVVFHAQAMSRRRRAVSVGRRSQLLDRRNSLLTLAGNLPLGPMLRSMAGNTAVSVLRALFFLIAKRVTAALDETAALASVLGHPLRLLRVRRLRAPGRRAAYGRLRAELPPGRSFRRVAEFAAAMSSSAQQDTTGSHHATEDPDDEDFLLTDSGLAQRILTSPAVLLFLGLLIVTGIAERSVLGAGMLGGGVLLPASEGASGLWREYLQGFHPTGIGSPTTAPPYLALVATLATVLLGKAWLAVDVILLGSVPIAGMAAYLAVRRVTTSVLVRVWAAATYALIPVATGAISAGRVGTAAAFALIPVIGLLAGRMFSQPPRIARRAAWATGLAIAFGTAFVPLLWPIALVATVLAALTLRTVRPAVLQNLAIVAIVPPVLLIPWTIQLATHPSALLLEAGVQQPGLASQNLPTRSLMLLSPGGPGLPPVWVTAGLVLAALIALVASRRRVLVVSGWTVAVLGLLVAVVASRVSVRPSAGGAAITAWPGIALAIAAAGLLLAAAAGGDSLGGLVSAGRTGLRRIVSLRGLAVGLLAVVACSAPILAGGFWLLKGVSGPIGPAVGQVVPELVTVSAGNGDQVRTLILSSSGSQVHYLLLRGNGPTLGDGDLTPVPGAEHSLRTAVASLVAPAGGQAVDQEQVLAQYDIGFVLMRAPVNPALARTLDGIAGLRAVSMTSSFDLWRLGRLPSRVTVVEPSGAVVPVPSGQIGVSGATVPTAGGTLMVSEPAGGWHATLNGHPLDSVTSPAGSWAQAFRLPSGGGTLDVGRSELGHDVGIGFELLAVLVVAALALPGVRGVGDAQAVPSSVPADSALAAGDTADGVAGGDSVPARGPAEPASGRSAGLPARETERRGGKGGSRGAGRRGRRPGQGEPAAPGGRRAARTAASQGSGRGRASPVAAGAAVGSTAATAGSTAAAAAAGLAAGRAAWPAGQPSARRPDGPEGPARPGAQPDRTAAGRPAFDPAFDDPDFDSSAPAGPGPGTPAYDATAAYDGAATYDGADAYDGAAYDGGPAYGGAAAYDGGSAYDSSAVSGDPASGGPAAAAYAPGHAGGRPGRDAEVRSPTGAWPYPDDAGAPARQDAAAGSYQGRPEAQPSTQAGNWSAAGQPEPPYGASAGQPEPPYGVPDSRPEPQYGAPDSQPDGARSRRSRAEPAGQEPIGPDRDGLARPDPGWQDTRWRDDRRPAAGGPEPSAGDSWPQQPEPRLSWSDRQSASSWSDNQPPPAPPARPEPPSSWPAHEQPSSWPAHEQPGSWPATDQASWSAGDQPSEWPGGAAAADWRSDGEYPSRAPAPATGQDWGPGSQQPGWAGADESLEPLPSADVHHGGPPPATGAAARPRWPAPERDDPDEREDW